MSPVLSVAFSPDGRTLAAAGGILWDLTEPARPRRLGQPLPEAVAPRAFSPDGQTLAAVADDSTVTLWDLTDRTQPRRLGRPLTGLTGPVSSVAFSSDGNTLAAASASLRNTVILWDLTPVAILRRDAVREACTRAGAALDEGTWAFYAPGVDYQDTCADR